MGIVKILCEMFFVYFFFVYLVKYVISSEDVMFYFVYRRFVKEEVIFFKNDVMYMVKEGNEGFFFNFDEYCFFF